MSDECAYMLQMCPQGRASIHGRSRALPGSTSAHMHQVRQLPHALPRVLRGLGGESAFWDSWMPPCTYLSQKVAFYLAPAAERGSCLLLSACPRGWPSLNRQSRIS